MVISSRKLARVGHYYGRGNRSTTPVVATPVAASPPLPISDRLPFKTSLIANPLLPISYFSYKSPTPRLETIKTSDEEGLLQFMNHDLAIPRLDQVVHLYNNSNSATSSKRYAASSSLYRLQHFFEGSARKRIIVTEFVELHLVYTELNVFIKPLPAYLLDRNYWIMMDDYNKTFEGLDMASSDSVLWRNALGFLLSYMDLIRSEMDFNVAMDSSHFEPLLPRFIDDVEKIELTYREWRKFALEVLDAYGEAIPACLQNTRWAYSCIDLYHISPNDRKRLFEEGHTGIDDCSRNFQYTVDTE